MKQFNGIFSECSINAHKHCKDLVVMECRSKQHASTHRSSSVLNGGKTEVFLFTSDHIILILLNYKINGLLMDVMLHLYMAKIQIETSFSSLGIKKS